MDLRQAYIGNKKYQVIDPWNFNPALYEYGDVAILQNGMLYPYENPKSYKGPTAETDGTFTFYNEPPKKVTYDPAMYSANNIVDIGNMETFAQMVNAAQALRQIENDILITTDNIFVPKIKPDDTPEMQALRQAIQAKSIDLEKYKSRFGNNYGNDKRHLENSNSITFGMLGRMMEVFDLKGTLILEDKNPNVPNPMNKKIVVELE